jgi:hypothetical protein
MSARGIVKNLALWKLEGESSFTSPANPIGNEVTATVADGSALHAVERHGEGGIKGFACARGRSALDSCCESTCDPFGLLQEGNSGFERDVPITSRQPKHNVLR